MKFQKKPQVWQGLLKHQPGVSGNYIFQIVNKNRYYFDPQNYGILMSESRSYSPVSSTALFGKCGNKPREFPGSVQGILESRSGAVGVFSLICVLGSSNLLVRSRVFGTVTHLLMGATWPFSCLPSYTGWFVDSEKYLEVCGTGDTQQCSPRFQSLLPFVSKTKPLFQKQKPVSKCLDVALRKVT